MPAPKEKGRIITAFVLDFETGGLSCQKSAATQLAVHAVRIDTFEVMETFNMYFKPYCRKPLEKPSKRVLKTKYELQDEGEELMEYSDEALEYSAITMSMLMNGVDLKDGCEQFIEFVKRNSFKVKKSEKPFIVGQNILFDLGFLTQILTYTDLWGEFTKLIRGSEDYWGNFQPYYVDTIIFCQLAFGNNKDIPNWKLEIETEWLGIDLDDAHDADADVTATREVLKLLTARMRNEDGGTGSILAETKKEKTREHFKI